MRKTIFTIILLIFSIPILAGDETRKGTTGAEQLLIPVGARGVATGGAFLSSLSGLEAIYYNPAGLGLMSGSEAMFSHMSYIADIGVSYFAVGTNVADLGSIALTYKTLDFGNIPVTTFDNPDGTGQTYSPGFFVVGLTYAKSVTNKVAAGFNFKIINESIMNTSASGIAIDFGVQYKFDNSFSIAAAVKNIGTNMEYTGEDLKIRTEVPGSGYGSGNGIYQADAESFEIPSYFELSTSYNFIFNEQNNILLGTTFRNNNALEDQLKFGLEYGFQNIFFIRGGYDMLLENVDDNVFGLALGAGLDYSFSDGIGVVFDYAYMEVKEFPTPNHVFTVKLAIE